MTDGRGKIMKFEIVRALDGKGMMETDYESCIPPDETIRSMIKAGYKAYKDGRVYKPKDGGKNGTVRTNSKTAS